MRIWSIVLDYLSFLPPAFLCFLPMKDLLRFSRRKTLALVVGVVFAAMLVLGWVQYRFALESNTVLLPMLAVCFVVYHNCQRATVWQSVSIFFASVALMSILSNMATCFGALWFGAEAGAGLYATLLLFLLMHVIFYFTVSGITAQKRAEARSRFLETQESQFAAQQRYIKETEKARHDFRHSIRTLSELYDAGDFEAVGTYLHRFVDAMPVNEVKYFCADVALNALLNYYDHLTAREGIAFSVQVRLPETLPVSDVDLCSMIGNILDNAVIACRKAEEKRIQLTVLTENAAQIYIVAVNSFSGVVKQNDGRYLSTDREGSGIGLASVASTAEAYGGVARFSHKGTEFYSNGAIPLG